MNDFAKFVAPAVAQACEDSISDASACCEAFTDAFNACELARMDDQLAFPHIMLSGADRLTWDAPGRHPVDFFQNLKASGWAKTEYVRKEAVLASANKVHFVVTYTRNNALGDVLSTHENLWVVVRTEDGWRIALRSY